MDVAVLSRVLVVNAGSTSLKLSVVAPDEVSTEVESLADPPAEVEAVGHRVVHGGPKLVEPVVIDDAVLAEIEAMSSVAPLHNAPGLAGIRAARVALGSDVPMVAVFDTAFHASLPDRVALRHPGGPRPAPRHPPLRLPRTLVPVDPSPLRPRCRYATRTGDPDCPPPRERLLSHR